MTEPGERIPIRRSHPPTFAEQVTARLQARQQQKGEKASSVRSEIARRRKERADRAERAKRVQEVAEDEGSTLEESEQ